MTRDHMHEIGALLGLSEMSEQAIAQTWDQMSRICPEALEDAVVTRMFGRRVKWVHHLLVQTDEDRDDEFILVCIRTPGDGWKPGRLPEQRYAYLRVTQVGPG